MSDERTKARQLMALALRTDFEQEARTAAMKAVRLIDQHDMLAQPPPPTYRPRAIASDYDARSEIAMLREQIAELRNERRLAAPARPRVPPPPVYTSFALLDLTTHMREIEQLRAEVARLQAPQPRPVMMHVVRPGDSATSIAAAYTGDPGRFQELVAANPQKPVYITPGGVRMFVAIVPGERLQLPVGWT